MSPEDSSPFGEHWCDGRTGRGGGRHRTHLCSRDLGLHEERRALFSVPADKDSCVP